MARNYKRVPKLPLTGKTEQQFTADQAKPTAITDSHVFAAVDTDTSGDPLNIQTSKYWQIGARMEGTDKSCLVLLWCRNRYTQQWRFTAPWTVYSENQAGTADVGNLAIIDAIRNSDYLAFGVASHPGGGEKVYLTLEEVD